MTVFQSFRDPYGVRGEFTMAKDFCSFIFASFSALRSALIRDTLLAFAVGHCVRSVTRFRLLQVCCTTYFLEPFASLREIALSIVYTLFFVHRYVYQALFNMIRKLIVFYSSRSYYQNSPCRLTICLCLTVIKCLDHSPLLFNVRRYSSFSTVSLSMARG